MFRDDEKFGSDFDPLTTWDDVWKFVQHFEESVPWWEGQQFHIYLSLLLRQKAAGIFKLSSLDKPTLCKAAILAKFDPLEFHADLQAVMEEHGKASGFSSFAFAMANATITNEDSPMYQRVTDKIVQLHVDDIRWRMDNDIPL